MGAYDDLLSAPRELHRRELLLVIFLEGRPEFVDEVGGRCSQGLDVCRQRKSERR